MTPMTHTLGFICMWLALTGIGVYECTSLLSCPKNERVIRAMWSLMLLTVSAVFAGGIVWQ